MKITKLMLSALAAAAVLVACNKEDLDPSVKGTGVKSVEISLENIVMTKGDAGEKISEGQAVEVKNFKIFLTDETYNTAFAAQDEDGNPAKFYWTEEDLANGELTVSYHFVDSKCERVIAVANAGDISLEDIDNFSKSIADQQAQDGLILVANSGLERVADNASTSEDESVHETTDGKYNELYKAELQLTPAISRFEIDGFAVAFSETPKFNEVKVADVAFDHYFPTMNLVNAGGQFGAFPTGNHVRAVADPTDDEAVYSWFNTLAGVTDRWYKDSFTDLVMTPDNPATADKAENVAKTAPRAYHFYSGTIVPTMFVKLFADGDPAYVWTDVYKKSDGSAIRAIEPGKIYRMSAGTAVEGGDGLVEIPDDLNPVQRCIDVTVDVVDWAVVLIKPDFTGGSAQQVNE